MQNFNLKASLMEGEVETATFGVDEDCVSGFWVCVSGKFNQSRLMKLVLCYINEKGWILKLLSKIFAEKLNQVSRQ